METRDDVMVATSGGLFLDTELIECQQCGSVFFSLTVDAVVYTTWMRKNFK